MKYLPILRTAVLGAILASACFSVVGCSVDENPITPEKMEDMRQKEAKERANFNPDMSKPKEGGTGQ